MTGRTLISAFAVLIATMLSITAVDAEEHFITVASTTSTADSGLFDHLLPLFTAKTGIEVRVVAKGTGQAIDLAKRGDADVLFVHDTESELRFVEEGFGLKRFDVMYNDFILVGPSADPAKIAGGSDIVPALAAIASAKSPFASRGDDSGTHKAELRLWKMAEIDPTASSGGWYSETGAGMGATLNTAAGLGAYVLADRATWLAFQNKADLTVMVEGDKRLFNPYGVIVVNPARFPHVKAADGQAFVDWLLSREGQQAIADFRIDGRQVFFPSGTPGT